jgi:hypothetical protein
MPLYKVSEQSGKPVGISLDMALNLVSCATGMDD